MRIEVKKIATLTGHSDSIYALDKGIVEHLIFSGSGDKIIAQWNLKTFQDATDWYNSKEYEPVKKIRESASTSQSFIVSSGDLPF